MKIKLYFFFVLIFFFNIVLNFKTFASENFLSNYSWKNRVLISVVSNFDDNFSKQVKKFLMNNTCNLTERNLVFFEYKFKSNEYQNLPIKFKSGKGLYLIGYDGNLKKFSKSIEFLDVLFEMIDEMPIRQLEMQGKENNC